MATDPKKTVQTASNEVFFPLQNDYNDWKYDVNDYIEKKTHFQGKAEPYKKVSYEAIKK